MKTKLFFLLQLCSCITFAQNHENSITDSLRKQGLIKEAIVEYSKLHKLNPNDKVNTYNYACALALDRQNDSAFYYLNIALIGDTTARPLNDPDFYFLMKDSRWQELEDTMIARLEQKYSPYENKELTKELWRMNIIDQAFYYHTNITKDELLLSVIWELKHKLNEQNLIRLEEIIDEHGWPKESVVGERAAGTVFLIIQHTNLETQKKYLPIMTENVKNGEASGASLAMLIDRINMREGKPQVYGSQIKRNEDGTFEVFEIENPQYVNQRRSEVGLPPIQEYVSRWGIEWTIEQLTIE